MRTIFLLLIVSANIVANGQKLLNIGDAAPSLQVRGWLKGTPIQGFERGRVYVVEFWATWCGPCKAAMPHLSLLASQYKKTVTVIGVDVMEKDPSIQRLKEFVDRMGIAMDYPVATEDSNFMTASWLNVSGESGIPVAFVVNREARVAWIGHPNDLYAILPKILNDSLAIEKAAVERKRNKLWEMLDDSASNELRDYRAEVEKRDPGKADSLVLSRVYEIVRKEPVLKYTPGIGGFTFYTLLRTDPLKAYEFGKGFLVTRTYEQPPYHVIFNNIRYCTGELVLPPQIYELGAEAYEARIDYSSHINDLPKTYDVMADWYWRAHNTSKAIEAEEKAIEALKMGTRSSADSLTAFESRLQQYKKFIH